MREISISSGVNHGSILGQWRWLSGNCIAAVVMIFTLSSFAFAAPPAGTPTDLSCAVTDDNGNGVTDMLDVNLNEIKSKGGATASNVDFIEIKILDTNVDVTNWQLCFSDNPSRETCINLGDGGGNGDYFDADPTIAPDGTSDDGPFDAPSYISFPADNVKADEGEVILLNDVGAVVDYIRYSNNTGICGDGNERWNILDDDGTGDPANGVDGGTGANDDVSECGYCFEGRDPSQKDFARVSPDGSGGWANNGDAPTEGATNDVIAGADRFLIVHDGFASTCLREAITITVLNPAGNPVTGYNGSVNLSISTGHGDWFIVDDAGASADPALGVLTDATLDDGLATYLFNNTDGGVVTLYLSNTHADDLTVTVADAGGAALDTSALLSFSDNMFVVNVNEPAAPFNAAPNNTTAVAGRPHQFQIQMVRRDNSLATPICGVAASYNVADIKAWISRDPDDPGGAAPSLTTASGTQAIPDVEPMAVNLTLPFVNGIADFTLDTADVGKYTILLKDDTTGFATTTILGGSALLVIRPFGFDIDSNGKRSVDWIDNGALDDSTGTNNSWAIDAVGTAFVKAGINFNGMVTAVIWQVADDANGDGIPDAGANLTDNAATPGFGLEAIPELVDVTHTQVVPAGGNPGTLTGGNNLIGFTAGAVTTALAYSETGIIDLVAAVGDGDYLGSGVGVVSTTEDFGRFYPDHFILTASILSNRIDSLCATPSTFSYMDEKFNINYTLTAENGAAIPATTFNYTGVFAKLPIAVANMNFGAIDLAAPATPLSGRLTVLTASGAWNNGVVIVDSDMGLARAVTEDGPYTQFTIGIVPTDADGVTMQGLDLDVDDSGANDHTSLGNTNVRYGRLVIGTAFGSELLPLGVPFQVQYFDGTNFLVNPDDNCSAFNAATDLSLSSNVEVGQTDGDIVIAGGGACPEPAAGCSQGTLVNSPVLGGDGGLVFSAPDAGSTGYGDITLDLSVAGLNMPWLQYDWDENGTPDDPIGRVTFGIYAGPEEFIYIREPW